MEQAALSLYLAQAGVAVEEEFRLKMPVIPVRLERLRSEGHPEVETAAPPAAVQHTTCPTPQVVVGGVAISEVAEAVAVRR